MTNKPYVQAVTEATIEEMERDKVRAEHVRREKAAHKAAMRYYINLKLRNNAMEIAMRDALDKVA